MIKVLIVDDDFMVAKIHQGYVRHTDGFAVVGMANSGASALEQAHVLQPDLVLLDIYLPDIGGLELLRSLREVAPEVDILVISAAREADTIRRALRGGIVHYLMKPFTHEQLHERLMHYKEAYAGLASKRASPGQADVDRVFGVTQHLPVTPKGVSAETLTLVLTELRSADGDLSATELGEALGISRGSARRYLEHLIATGQAEVHLRYGEVGRPERRYALR